MSLFWFRRHIYVSALGAAAAVAVVSWLLVVQPLYAVVTRAEATFRSRGADRDRLAGDRAAFERLRSASQKMSAAELEKISRVVPNGNDVPRLIVTLESLASETGVFLRDVGVSEKGEGEKQLPQGVKPIDLAVTVSGGDYGTLKRFLESVEKNVRLLDVRNFTFARGLQSYTIGVRAYYVD